MVQWRFWRVKMEYTMLGQTGIKVSRTGLGAGGHSRLGRETGNTEKESIKIVQRAIELGITFIDTAEDYHTEEIVGKALSEMSAKDAVISSKMNYLDGDDLIKPSEIERHLEESLEKLGRSHIDVYHVHGVTQKWYDGVVEKLYPELIRQKKLGKIRCIGITEYFGRDTSHTMLKKALASDLWDVIMIGFNMLNPSAKTLIQKADKKGVGVLDMFAVRKALQSLESLQTYLDILIEEKSLDRDELKGNNPFQKALETGVCKSLPEMAYRFCRHTPGMHVVLTGTGVIEHLEQNVKSLAEPPLPEDLSKRLDDLLGSVDTVSGN